jgi:lauroyl/myristoyl acyltransferase
MPAGPAVLARDTGAALVPATLSYAGRDLEIHFHDEVQVGAGQDGIAEAMQDVADAFTSGITAHPEDWHMMQKVFADDLH